MKLRVSIVLVLLLAASSGRRLGAAAAGIPLTIQEALYPGSVAGVSRTNDPVTVGIPMPDDATTGATDASQLTLTGASAGQFRVLGRWPSGRIKWVLVDTLASVNAGGQATGIALATGGSGNFGGPDLAVDNGSTIVVSTGPATFTIRKPNFNGFYQVDVGGTTVVTAGSSPGLALVGPPPGSTTCPCTTLYTSSQDASSTAVIEENGPVRSVVKATGAYRDAAGNVYMRFTVRMYFYKGLTRVKAVTTLRNADNGDSGSFAVAYKAVAANEWRLAATLSGTRTYQIAKHGGAVETGTMSGTDDISLYQGQSLLMKEADWCGSGCVPYTTDTGYVLKKNGATIATGTEAPNNAPGGWADINDSTGVGVTIGVYQMAAYWPKSLEFKAGGSDVRIGIWPSENSRTYYQSWPQWSTHDLFFDFHAAPTTPGNEFLKFQHYLIARAPYTHYNATKVFPYPMVDPAVEQTFYQTTGAAAVPAISTSYQWPYLDKGTLDTANWNLPIWRFKDWGAPGGGNQIEFHWSYFMNWITRGMTGRYLDSMHFYRFLTDDVFPHSDGFDWRDQTSLTEQGFQKRTSANSANGFRSWIDVSHPHWYGLTDYYFLTGDELAKEQLLDGVKDYYTTSGVYAVTGQMPTTRAVGLHMVGAARYASFLKTIGDTATATTVLANATTLYNKQVKTDLCPNSDAPITGCTPNLNPAIYNEGSTPGTSRLRGIHWAFGFLTNYCGLTVVYRHNSSFPNAMLVQGILELRDQNGTAWADYWNALDLAYGISQGSLTETYYDDGSGRWDRTGFRANSLVDWDSATGNGGPACPPDDDDYEVNARATEWMHFYVQYLVTGSTAGWQKPFTITTQRLLGALGVHWQEDGSYQVSALISALKNPGSVTLINVPITNVVSNGGGSYTISWTVPPNTQSYRIKWGPKRIVDWIGFDAGSYRFIGDPRTTMNWFAATNVPTLPTPMAAGSMQSITISTGMTALAAANFSVKAYVGGSTATAPAPSPALTSMSGDGQTGIVGTVLSTPLTVKVYDSNSGTPMSGVTVAFAVTAGGGAVSSASVVTDASGLASTTLTLGATAGSNVVTANAGTIAGSPVTFSEVAAASTTPSVTPSSVVPVSSDEALFIQPNQWINVTPAYQGAPNGGQLVPSSWNNIGVYDPSSKQTIVFDHWYDSVRKMSIYANSLIGYEPISNAASILKADNWTFNDTTTDPLPANASDPTPIDRHPLGGLALDPTQNAVYLVNGANQTGHAYYPDHPNDTWKFSLATRSWRKVSDAATATHPPSDVGTYSGMVYDPPTGKLAYFVVTEAHGTQTWLFDTSKNLWSQLPQDASASGVYICGAGIAYDLMRNQVVAFGGGANTGSPASTKVWSYSVSTNKWTPLPDAPLGGSASELAYDSVHDVFLALVGQSTLIYNPRTKIWVRLAALLDRAGTLAHQNVTFNAAQDVFVFQGGTAERPVWALFRYSDPGSPAVNAPSTPSNVRIIR
jgi:hypothetical protein